MYPYTIYKKKYIYIYTYKQYIYIHVYIHILILMIHTCIMMNVWLYLYTCVMSTLWLHRGMTLPAQDVIACSACITACQGVRSHVSLLSLDTLWVQKVYLCLLRPKVFIGFSNFHVELACWSKGVVTLPMYGQMQQQRWEQAEKRKSQ